MIAPKFLYLVVIAFVVEPSNQQDISLSDNGYGGLLVAISDHVSQTEFADFLEDLQVIFTDMSAAMYVASRQMTYLRSITVLIPGSWDAENLGIVLDDAEKETFNTANIRIDRPNPSYGNKPYSFSLNPRCGEGWDYTHLTPEFVSNMEGLDKEQMARVMVGQWGHLRWGLGSEYPRPGEDRFYLDPDICIAKCPQIPSAPVRCGEELKFYPLSSGPHYDCYRNSNTGLPSDECRYEPIPQSSVESSLMFDIYTWNLNGVDQFCDNDPSSKKTLHDKKSPTQHNKLCSGKSSWDVLREHQDFQGNSRQIADTSPSIRFVQQPVTKVVLVLDISGSMNNEVSAGDTRLVRMNQAAAQYIQTVCEGTYVGIVTFGSTATTARSLTLIDGPESRHQLIYALPKGTSGSTCIGCGLEEGLKVLGVPTAGGFILVITDGGENVHPYIAEVQDSIVNGGVTVDSILYTTAADDSLPNLSAMTGGNTFFDDGSPESTQLMKGFLGTITKRQAPGACSSVVQLLTDGRALLGNDRADAKVTIDDSVGYNTVFSFTYPPSFGAGTLHVILTTESGNVYSSTNLNIATDDVVIGSLSMTIPGKAESGKWNIHIENTKTNQLITQILVQSYPADADADPISAAAVISAPEIDLSRDAADELVVKIFTHVTQGYGAVINADVIAIIVSSLSDITEIPLLDDGLGADSLADDGVYSAYFSGYDDNGKFTVDVRVTSNADTEVYLHGTTSRRKKRSINGGQEAKKVTSLERIASAGFFEVKGYESLPTGGISAKLPPADVQDFRMINNTYENRSIVFSWTAVGEDLMSAGPAGKYHLSRCFNSTSAEDLTTCDKLDSSDLLEGDLENPSEPQRIERLVIQVDDDLVDYVHMYVLQVEDNHGLLSSSATAAAGVFSPELKDESSLITSASTQATSDPPMTSYAENPNQTSSTFPKPTTQGESENSFWSTEVIIITSVITGLLLSVIILMIGICIKLKDLTQSNKSQTSSTNHDLSPQAAVTPSRPGVTVNVGHVAPAYPDVMMTGSLTNNPEGHYPYIPRAKRGDHISRYSGAGFHPMYYRQEIQMAGINNYGYVHDPTYAPPPGIGYATRPQAPRPPPYGVEYFDCY